MILFCSGFVAYVTEHIGISPEEAARVMSEAGEIVVSRSLDSADAEIILRPYYTF